MSKSYCNLLYHLVFSTKDREPWLDGAMRPRVHEYLGGAIRGEGGVALAINGTADHVHVFCKLRQDKAVSDVVRAIKANSSGWIRRTFANALAFHWQTGFGGFTVSHSLRHEVRSYIENQQRHHRQMTFKEELIILLDKNDQEYDERDLWR